MQTLTNSTCSWFFNWCGTTTLYLNFEKNWNGKVEQFNKAYEAADELEREALDNLLSSVENLGTNKKYDEAETGLNLWPKLLPAMSTFYQRRRTFVERDKSKLSKESEQAYDEDLGKIPLELTKSSYEQGLKSLNVLIDKHRQETSIKEARDRVRNILVQLEDRVTKLPEDLAKPLQEKLKPEREIVEKSEAKVSDLNQAGKRLSSIDSEVFKAETERDARPERTKDAQELLSKIVQYQPKETWGGDEAKSLVEKLDRIKKLLEKLPPSVKDLFDAQRVYDNVPSSYDRALRVATLSECRQRSQKLIETIQERLPKGRSAVMDPIGEQLKEVAKVVKNHKTNLKNLQSAETTLQQLDTSSHAEVLAKDPIDKLVEKVNACKTPKGVSPEQSKTFGELRSKTLKTLETATAEDGKKAVEELEKKRSELEEATKKLAEELAKDLGGEEEMEKLYENFSLPELKKLSDDAGGAAKLKGMLDAVTPEKFSETAEQLGGTKALAEIVETGFGGDAKKLTELTKEFGGDLTPVATLLDKGGLKASPKVVANLIKEGFGGDIKQLKTFTEAFQKEEDLAKLAKVVKSGGLDGSGTKDNKDASDTLGKLLKDGLEGDPKNLLALAEAFNDKPEKLKTMVVAFNDEPTPPPAKAGERLGKAYSRLKQVKPPPDTMGELVKFHDEVATFADKATKYSAVELSDPGMYLSKGDLLRQAITFGKKPKDSLKRPTLPSGFTASMDHFCRHSREFCSFSEGDSDLFMNATADVSGSSVTASIEDIANGNVTNTNSKLRKAAKGRAKDTTLWNEGVTDKQIATYCEDSFKKVATVDTDGNVTGFAATAGITLIESKPDFKSFELEVDTKTKLVVRIGIDTVNKKVTQFFPISADPPLSTLVWGDMMAIKKAMQF
ncbi:MAG: hypothetical protein U1A77_09280 [Pirellulales bacterium]